MRPFRQVDCRSWFSYAMGLLLHTDGTNTLTVEAVAVARADIAGIEVQVVSAVAVAHIE